MDPKLLEEIRAELTRWGMGGVVKPVVLSDLLNRLDKELGADWKSLAINKQRWEAVEWRPEEAGPMADLSIRLMRSPFYEGIKYAVRRRSMCLNKESGWEYEPFPSGRDEEFYARCRFDSFADALAALEKAKPEA